MLSGGETRPSGRQRKNNEASKSKPRRVSSAVTSGRKLFVLGNGNSPWSRRYSDLVRLHEQDISGGAPLSQAQLSLVRRAAAIECELEVMEGKLSLGQDIDLDVFTRSASHLRRILATVGLKRVPRDVPTLAEHLAALARERPPAADDDDAALDTLPADAEGESAA